LAPCPLDLAARYGVLASAKVLIERGASICPKDAPEPPYGNSPIHHAAGSGQVGIMELLVAVTHSGTRTQRCVKMREVLDCNSTWHLDYTPLHFAAEGGHEEAAKWLIRRGANINAQEGDGMSPVAVALLKDKEDIAALIQSLGGIKIDPHAWRGRRTLLPGVQTKKV